jgi:ABC-type multidrug transport system fused ATPase/permease subunit
LIVVVGIVLQRIRGIRLLSTLKKFLALFTTEERKRGVLVLILVIGMAFLETAGVASVMPFLAVLGNPDMLNTNTMLSTIFQYSKLFGIRTPEQFFIALGFCSFLIIILSAVYRTLTHYVMNRFIEMRRHTLGSRLLETYLRQPYAFFLDRHSGEMSKIILSEVDQFIGNVVRPAFNMFAFTLVFLSITAMLLWINPLLALLATGLLGGIYVLIFQGVKRKLARLGRRLVSADKARFMSASEAFGGIKDIKLIGREHSYLSRFNGSSEEFAATVAANLSINQVPKYLIETVAFGGIVLMIAMIMISAGGLGSKMLGDVLPIVGLYTFSAYRLQPALQSIFSGIASMRYGEETVRNLFNDLNPQTPPLQLPAFEPAPLKAKNTIGLKNLSYTYPNASKAALMNLNLEVPIGSAVGLVGSTGAGKTTMVDVILGLLRPTQGAITVDGLPVLDAQIRSWQRLLGYVPQEIFLADATIAENIAFGIPKAEIDYAKVERCARSAQVHGFIIQDLPEKYQTQVGERGVRLSGGQRQRIGIARALYRDPDVLVFDEATSALDPVTEQAVMAAINGIANQKTIFIIAHRLSTLRNCNPIVLIQDGQIKSCGDFERLMGEDEQFKKFVDLSWRKDND